jgi:hypothetical protein
MQDDFEFWLDGAPVIDVGGDANFGLWLEGAPMLGTESSWSEVGTTRRRATMSFID